MIAVFFGWWFGQLADLLPAWLRRVPPTSADALVVSPIGALGQANTVAVALRRNGREALLGRFALGADELRDLARSPGRPVVLKLARTEFLEKTLVVPLAAQSELDQVVAFEMDRETPFEHQEVYWKHAVEAVDRHRQQLRVRLLLTPKCRLEPLLSVLARSGLAPRWAEIADTGKAGMYVPLGGDGSRLLGRSDRLLWPAAACCALLALGAAATPFVRQSLQLASLDREIHAARLTADQAEALRREIDGLARSADLIDGEAEKAARPLEALAAVTGILPDDTYLTEFELRQRKLTLSGRSAGAARLIGALAADGAFRNPAFAAPITRLEALHAEVFTLNADVGPQP